MSKRRAGGAPSPGPQKRRRDREDDREHESERMDFSQGPDFHYVPTMAKEAEVGIIEGIWLKNFMCHNSLDFKFKPHVNFITGRNGSGKSAIMTALVVGLGGKASHTNRGSSVKGFIKHGKQTAEVVVKLRNRGSDAYKVEEYGDTIVVERSFRGDGGSSYKLKSKDGRLVSTKREELVHILDQFNIQVENPVVVLNQDTSRNFLHSSKPQDKYKLFLKATQLEQMKLDYALANEQRKHSMDIIEQKEKMLPRLEREVLEWEQKYKAVASLDDLRKKVDNLKKEMVWSLVASKEKELDPIIKELKKEDARKPRFENRVRESQEKVDACHERRRKIQEKVQACGREVKELEPQLEQQKRVVNEKKNIHKAAVMDYKKRESDQRSANKEKSQLSDKIQEIRSSAQQDQSERIAREEHMTRLMENLQVHHDERRGLEHQLEQHRNAINRLREASYQIKNEESDLRQEDNELTSKFRSLEAAQDNRLRRFGDFMPDLWKRIDDAARSGRFHVKPKGPVGMLIHPVDPNWALAIEACLKGLLFSFCCTDHHDERVLEEVMREVRISAGKKPTIVVSRFLSAPHDVSRSRAQSNEFPTVLDMLQIEDPVIKNCLIDQRSIENTILIKDVKVARQVMMRNPPQNCRDAFTPKGDQLLHSPTFRYYSSNCEQSQYLKVNVNEQKSQLMARKAEVRRQLQEVDGRLKRNISELKENERQEKMVTTKLMKNQEKISKMNNELTDLSNMEEPEAADVMTLEEDLQKINETLEAIGQQLMVQKNKCEETKIEKENAEEKYKETEQRMRAVADMADPFKEELGQVESDLEYAKNSKRHYDMKMKEHMKKIKDIQSALDDAKKDLQEKVAMAGEVCPRIATRRSPHNLESEILQISKQIKAEEKNHGNKEEITMKYSETKHAFEKIRLEVRKCKKFIQTLKDVMNDRQRQYFEFRRMIAIRTRYFFIMMLSNRHYQGKISFNHDKEMLTLSVQPAATGGAGPKDMKSLSGGERSFTTVCFILALWDAMESPFRCLDEFDVFMDMVNRRISTSMMLTAAEQQKGRQFIFLTPQNLDDNVKNYPNIGIFEMPSPVRGQQTLNFARGRDEEEENGQ